MVRVTNFGDPSYEPTDEELAELMHEAFADVPARNAAAMTKLHETVARLRDEAMKRPLGNTK
jgi:predicted Zn-dependent protease with MMP-like domain